MAGLLTGSVFSEDTQTFQGRRRQPPWGVWGAGQCPGPVQGLPLCRGSVGLEGPAGCAPVRTLGVHFWFVRNTRHP